MSPAVSVLVPTYNRSEMLVETLDAILSQSRAPSEIIVVDDGSTDKTEEAVKRFGRKIQYHRTVNGGICKARNVAASLATSPFLAFCDHDDIWREDKLELQMSLHMRDVAMQYSFTNFSIVRNGVWSERTEFDHAPDRSFPPYSLSGTDSVVIDTPFYDQILSFQPVRPSTVVISADLFRKIRRFREEFGKNPSEDIEFTLRCMQHPPIGIVREPVVGVRVYGGNYSSDDYRNMRGQIEVFEYVLKNHNINEHTRKLVLRELDIRKKQAAYGAFRKGEFDAVASWLGQISPELLDSKDKAKLWISKMPLPLAKLAQSVLLKRDPLTRVDHPDESLQ